MKLRLLLPLFLISILSISATSVKIDPTPVNSSNSVFAELPAAAASVQKSKLNFFERLILKYTLKKFQKAEDTSKADKQASTSLSFGIAAISLLLVGLFVPYVILATIPTGIVALATGNSALKGGTKETSKARTGKTLGLASLITLGALLIIGTILLAVLFSNWGG